MSYPTITAWSYSRYETWAQCPRKAYYKFVAKLPEGPKGPALVRGIAAHEVCAAIYNGQWPKGAGRPLPVTKEWMSVLSMHKTFYGSDLEAELQLAYDKDWNRTEWYDKQTVFRCAFDGMAYTPARHGVLQLYEHKTGKVRELEHKQQATLYAGVSTLVVPDAEKVVVDIHYLDVPAGSMRAVMRTEFSRVGARDMLAMWKDRGHEMMADTEYPTRAGVHCRWCPYAASKGGPCDLG